MKKYHLHLISDSTGGTLGSVVKACLAQFEGVEAEQHFWPLVRSEKQLDAAIEGIGRQPGMVLYTLVDDALSLHLERACQKAGVPCLSILRPAMQLMSGSFGLESRHEPGLQHRLNAEYFARMDAMDYALHHDDGQKSRDLGKADVILVGVSRTSKTPTSIYLANRGVKAANIPVVKGCPLPQELFTVTKPLIVGLVTNAERLVEIRRNRLRTMHEERETSYADLDAVKEEILYARRLFNEHNWPVIDVTRRSIEETAAAILNLLVQRENGNNGTNGK